MSNNVTVDLKANPQGIKVGVGEASKEIDKFAKDGVKSLEQLGETSKELEERIGGVKDKLSDLIASNTELTEKQAALGVAFAATATELAACVGLFGPLVAVLANAKGAADIASLALGNTSKTIEELNPAIDKLTKELIKSAGGFEQFKKQVQDAGMELKDFGLNTETNAERVSQATSKMFGKIGNGEYKKTWNDAKEYIGSWADSVSARMTKLANDSADNLVSMAKDGGKLFSSLRNTAARGIGNLGSAVGLLTKADESDTKANEGGQAAREKREKQEGIENAKNNLRKESLAFEKELQDAKAETARVEREDIEINGTASLKVLNEKIAANKKLQNDLRDQNKLHTDEGIRAVETGDKLIAQSKELGQQIIDRIKESKEFAEETAEISKGFQRLKENAVIAAAPVGLLKAMLSDAKDELEELNAEQTSGGERRIKDLQKIAELTKIVNESSNEEDKERAAAEIVEITEAEEKRKKKRLEAAQRVGDLESELHQQELDDIDELNARKEEQISKELDLKKRAAEEAQDFAELKLNTAHEASLKRLQVTGASERATHYLRVAYLEEEAKLAIENADTEIEKDNIRAQLKKALFKEEAALESAELDKADKIKAVSASVKEAELDAAYKRKMAKMQLDGATSEKLHKAAMQHIGDEEMRAIEKSKSDVERAMIVAAATKARIQETTEYEIAKEKEKHEKLKNLEKDVKDGKISREEGLAKSGVKPLTRKEINAKLKQRVKDRKEAVELAKDNKEFKKKDNSGKVAKQEATDKRKEKNEAKAAAMAKAKGAVAERLAAKKDSEQRFKDRQAAVDGVKDKIPQKAEAGAGNSDKLLGKVEEHLKNISDAAKTTNEHELQQLRALESVGKLA